MIRIMANDLYIHYADTQGMNNDARRGPTYHDDIHAIYDDNVDDGQGLKKNDHIQAMN